MRRSALALLAVCALVGVPLGAGAAHSWGGYHWSRQANPLVLGVVDSVTPDWDSRLVSVSADWSVSAVLDAAVQAGDSSTGTRKKCPAPTGKLRVCSAAYGFNGWLGIAEIWLSGSHIAKARARVNDSYFSTAAYNDENARRHVLCQEVGHALGLGHQYAVTCMNDHEGLLDPAYAVPNAHDYEQLEATYAHLDGGVTGSAVQAAGGHGQPHVTGDGEHTLVTWIFWARR